MLTIFVLFVGLTLATAVIAYWSDNLGKKLGKKRVSLWGMRPRTTATFLTIASSWLIMVFTLGVMLTIFPPLRQSLLRFDEVQAKEKDLRESAKQLTGKVGNLDAQLVELRSQKESLEAQVANDSRRLKESRAKLTKSQAEAEKANKARQAAQKQAANARKSAAAARERQAAAVERETAARDNLQTVRGQLGATRTQREKAEQQLKRAQNELKSANVEVENANDKVAAANNRVQTANAAVAAAQARVVKAQTDLTKVQTDLSKARDNEKLAKENARIAEAKAEQSRADAEAAEQRARQANISAFNAGNSAYKAGAEVLKAQTQVEDAKKRVAELQAQGEDLQRANALVLKTNESLGAERDIILSSNIRVPVGRTLVERSFDKGVSFGEASEDLRALFGRAADKIVPGFLSGARLQLAPRVVPALDVEEGAEQSLVVLDADEIFTGLADAISRNQNSLSVRLVAERNHLEGEKTLYARFIVVPIRSALPANAELARATFDPKIGDARLFSALLKLVEAGREVAGQNGITPPLSPEAPDFYAPGSNEQIFETLRKISAYDVPVRVRIVTATPISTTDQLRVRFEIEPLATTARATRSKAPA